MAYISTLGSPGVEVHEKDASQRVSLSSGTTIFVPGYASQGPVEEIMTISSIEDFENIYGTPTNMAESYFYYTVLAIIQRASNTANILTCRMPYGKSDGDTISNAFSMLVYPAIPVYRDPNAEHYYPFYQLKDKINSITNLDHGDLTTNPINGTINVKSLNVVLGSKYQSGTISIADVVNPTREESAISLNLTHSNGDSTTTLVATMDPNNVKIVKNEGSYDYQLGGVVRKGDDVVGLIQLEFTLVSDVMIDIEKIQTTTLHIQSDDTTGVSASVPFGKIDQEGNIAPFNTAADLTDLYFDKSFKNDNNDIISLENLNVTYLIGAPITYQVSYAEYYQLITGESMKWSNSVSISNATTDAPNIGDLLKSAAMIVINTSRSIINENYEGFYFGLTDNIFNEPSDNRTFNAISGVKTTKYTCDADGEGENYKYLSNDKFFKINDNHLDFYTASNNTGSVSKILQTACTQFDTSGKEYDDTISLSLMKLSRSTMSNKALKLAYSIREKYNASLGESRIQGTSEGTRPISYFIEKVTKDSNNLLILVNPFISKTLKNDMDGNLTGKVRIASDKLHDGLKEAEDEYLLKPMSINLTTVANSKMNASDLAINCLKNYDNVCNRAGMNLGLYEQLMKLNENTLFKPLNELYPLGVYTVVKSNNKVIGNTPNKVERALRLIENDEEYPDIDILVNGGLSTIYTYSNGPQVIGDGDESMLTVDENNNGLNSDENNSNSGIFVDSYILQGIEDMRSGRSSLTEYAEKTIQDYQAVENKFLALANSYTNGGRNDTFYISEPLRGIYIKGRDSKIEKVYGTQLTNNVYNSTDVVNHSWSMSVYWPHKHLFDGFVSSYSSVYAQWFKINDPFSDSNIWIPSSGFVAGIMASNDAAYGPWFASAGLNRGVVNGIIDCAISPTAKQRTDLYKICINSIPKLTGIGATVWGIRTMSKVASAMDQNTCRRTILNIIKTIKKYLRYYVFEPNTAFTRLACFNDLDPYLSNLVSQGAIYGYRLVVDTSNNTPEVINNGEMAVDLSVQPTRTAENIVLSITANKYTADISTNTFNAD